MSDSGSRPSLADSLYGPRGPSQETGSEFTRQGRVAQQPADASPAQPRGGPPQDLALGLYGSGGPRNDVHQTPAQTPTPAAARPTAAAALYPDVDIEPADDNTPGEVEPQQQPAGPDPLHEEFDAVMGAMGLSREEGDQLLELHGKAIETWHKQHEQTTNQWRQQSEKTFGRQYLEGLRNDLNRAIGNDRDAQEFKRLLSWSGIGNNPSAIRAISRLLGRR